MSFRRTWKDAALASALALAWVPLGCGEAPPPATPPPKPAPEALSKASKGKKKDPNLEMGFAELREQRRKARAAAEASKVP